MADKDQLELAQQLQENPDLGSDILDIANEAEQEQQAIMSPDFGMKPEVAKYMMDKHPSLKDKLLQAQEQRSAGHLVAGLGHALDTVAAAGTTALGREGKPSAMALQANQAMANQAPKNVMQEQALQQQEAVQESTELNVTRRRRELERADPTSEMNRKFQASLKPLAQKHGIEGPISHLTVDDLVPGSLFQTLLNASQREDERREKFLMSLKRDEDKRAWEQSMFDQEADLKRELQAKKAAAAKERAGIAAGGLAGRLSDEGAKAVKDARKEGMLDFMVAMRDVDAQIDLSDVDQEVLGAGPIAGLLPDALKLPYESAKKYITSGEGLSKQEKAQGIKLLSAVSSLENALLKARSGAAVSAQEFERLRDELGRAKGMGGSHLITAMARIRDVLRARMESYRAQGGEGAYQSLVKASGYDPNKSEAQETGKIRIVNKRTGEAKYVTRKEAQRMGILK